ncbi:hypothetical protein [Methylobacterium soli]|uniref:hypothetical protein n=1 Tax=Methylobacterium soli TaxID=553447 RepID=UPI0017817D8F|nr:hypothetical protein [Methylobacterium soli]
MQKPLAHPFTITVGPHKPLRGTFSWAVSQRGGIEKKQSRTSYASFEEARLAGKAVLDEMIENWRREALQSAGA